MSTMCFALLGLCSGLMAGAIALRYPQTPYHDPTYQPHWYWFSGSIASIAFALLSSMATDWSTLLLGLVWTSILLTMALVDIRLMILPDEGQLLLVGLALLRLASGVLPWQAHLLGLLAALPLYGLSCALPQAMGRGDGKLFLTTGLFLGWPGLAVAYSVALASALLFIIVGYATGRLKRQSRLPFGPFIAFGAFVAYLWGAPLLNFYLNFFRY